MAGCFKPQRGVLGQKLGFIPALVGDQADDRHVSRPGRAGRPRRRPAAAKSIVGPLDAGSPATQVGQKLHVAVGTGQG